MITYLSDVIVKLKYYGERGIQICQFLIPFDPIIKQIN